jgi:hypothetical protein
MHMKHDVTDYKMDINQYVGLKYGTKSPGYRAVRKAVIELTIEKMLGASQSTKNDKGAVKGCNKE